MAEYFTLTALATALVIFLLRVADMTLDTMRLLFVVRGRKELAWILGFFQAAIFVVAISSVLSRMGNPLNLIGYSAGFATGNVFGMMIEERLAIGFVRVSIISSTRGRAVADELRSHGYAVTEIAAHGKDGTVNLLNSSVRRKDVDRVETIVLECDPTAFVTAEDVRPIRRGFWRA